MTISDDNLGESLLSNPNQNPDDNDNGNDNGNDNDNDNGSTSTVDTDDSEFAEFISSCWKDSVEIGLKIEYPLPSTNYLEDDNSNEDNDSDSDNGDERLSPLTISTVLPEGSIAPLFDGTQWAGTRVWKAAVLGLEYLVKRRNHQLNSNASDGEPLNSLLELGCGLGVPGMVWKQLLDNENAKEENANKARIVLTDRDSLVDQLRDNVRDNFKDCSAIEAKVLDWSRDGIAALLAEERALVQNTTTTTTTTKNDKDIDSNKPVFDVCLNCDCVYEPLYGREAWESLADVLIEIAVESPGTLLVTALERRNQDNVEGFLDKLRDSGTVQLPIQKVVRHDADPHHVIEIYVTKGRSSS